MTYKLLPTANFESAYRRHRTTYSGPKAIVIVDAIKRDRKAILRKFDRRRKYFNAADDELERYKLYVGDPAFKASWQQSMEQLVSK